MFFQDSITVRSRGRGSYDITDELHRCVAAADCRIGLVNVFIHHTSASLIICENADPTVRHDLETFIGGLVTDGDRRFEHDTEGPDDMAAHIRSILTATTLTVPISNSRCALGTWQGVYLWEHRYNSHQRQITITVQGER